MPHKNPKRDPLALNDSLSTLNIPKIKKGDPFVALKNFSRNFISGIRYIRNSLFRVFVKSGMGCVIVEGTSSLFKGSW